MTKLAIDHILVEHNVGEVRAAAMATDCRPWHLFWQRWGGVREAVRHGQIIEARVRSKDEAGNAFLDHITTSLWEGGFEALFMNKTHAQNLHEGQTLKCRVICAARQDHSAKVVPCDASLPLSKPEDAFAQWQQSLERHSKSPLSTNSDTSELLSSAFEETLVTSVALSGGGMIHIERTRALTAIDVDSLGRVGKGSAGAKALSLNKNAVSETVRQLSLRGLGGAVVVDCVEPLNRDSKEQIKSKFINIYQDIAGESLGVVELSKIGLLQAAIPWRHTPWGEVAGNAESALLSLLREAQRQLEANPASFFTLALGASAYEAYLLRKEFVDKAIQDRFHGRLTLEKAQSNQEGLKPR